MCSDQLIRNDLGMTSLYPTQDEWLAGLSADERARAQALCDRFARLGADQPHLWARSELEEGIPQMGRFLFLRTLWTDAINRWQDPRSLDIIPAAHRLRQAGADQTDLSRLARAVAFETVLEVLQLLDEGEAEPARQDPGLPGWYLCETDNDGNTTNRCIGGLHESILETDPSGQEAEDLWE
jgi:hypothetical protein